MICKSCSRLWQVEAARDGRLSGRDVASAERHRETCSECAEEARALSQLGASLSALPELDRNALGAARARQTLMAALNDSLIAAPRLHYTWRVAAVAALASALFLSWLALRQSHVTSPATSQLIDVYAAPGARWSARTDERLASVDFSDGAASFVVHPHRGRRVVVRLPDGEIEDMGTVFEVRVSERHTRRVAVSEGKLVVRLAGQPEFSLAAGESWEPAPPSAAPATSSRSSEQVAAPSSVVAPLRHSVALGPRSASAAAPVATDAASSNAEDDAYLHIVSLLRSNQTAQARSEAKRYLLRFPTAFRRVEVLNIAMRGAAGGSEAAPGN